MRRRPGSDYYRKTRIRSRILASAQGPELSAYFTWGRVFPWRSPKLRGYTRQGMQSDAFSSLAQGGVLSRYAVLATG
jgi:hypothetical protein